MSFEEVQREYDLTIEDIRAALKLPVNWLTRNNIILYQPEFWRMHFTFFVKLNPNVPCEDT